MNLAGLLKRKKAPVKVLFKNVFLLNCAGLPLFIQHHPNMFISQPVRKYKTLNRKKQISPVI